MKAVAPRFHDFVLLVLGLALAALLGLILWNGLDFYGTPLAERPHHPDFRSLRPAGTTGHWLGIVGSAMILLLLLYSLRKRVRALRNWGDLRIWLKYHIFLGVAGPVLITFHTAGKVGGLVSVSFWSMVAVAASGVFGRFLYQQLPRNVLGEALTAEQIETQGEALLVELTGPLALDQEALASLEDLALGPVSGRAAPLALMALPAANLGLSRRLEAWRAARPDAIGGEAIEPARRWVLLQRRWTLFHTIRDLFHYWHVFHKPFAIIMILVMFIHVGVAVLLGYSWPGAGEAGA